MTHHGYMIKRKEHALVLAATLMSATGENMTSLSAVDKTRYIALTDELPCLVSQALLKCSSLPTLPAVALKILEIARTPDATLHDYAQAIEYDPALTARLIAVANSVQFIHSSQPVDTSLEATQRLGLDATLATVLSFSLLRHAQGNKTQVRIWQRAITSAIVASRLAHQLCPAHRGSTFTAALLQDIGILALQAAYPQEVEKLYANSESSHQQIARTERQQFGCDHTLVGAWLAAKWGMPTSLVDAIYQSHDGFLTDQLATLCVRLSGPIADAWLSEEPVSAFATLLRQLSAMESAPLLTLDNLLHRLQEDLAIVADTLQLAQPIDMDSHALLIEAQQLLFQHTLTLSARLDEQTQRLESLHQHYATLEKQSRLDPLTQLANRAWLEEQLRERFVFCQENNRTMSVVFIDLDHFKTLNDRYGHRIGDQVLEHFGHTLSSLIRTGDLAGRYGGEEFLIILPDETAQSAKLFSQRITQHLQERPMTNVDQQPIYVSVSIGVACLCDGDFSNERELIDAADQSMYCIKRSGRGGIATYGGE